jgi:hypothetical protein
MIFEKWISIGELKIYGVAVAGVTMIAILITVLVMSPKDREVADVESDAAVVSVRDIPDLLLPNEEEIRYTKNSLVRYRPVMDTWTEEQVNAFWIDPQIVGLEILRQRNDALIDEIFAEIP